MYNNNQRIPQFIDRKGMTKSFVPWHPGHEQQANQFRGGKYHLDGDPVKWRNGYVPLPTPYEKERRVCIIGAGPVGLYTAFRFLQGNYFSDKTFEECSDFFKNGGTNAFGQIDNTTIYTQWKKQNSQCASYLKIAVMEKRGAILCGGASILTMPENELSKSYQVLLTGRGVVDFPTLLKATKDNCDVPEKYWAERQQVFYITRANLQSFDPIIQFLLRSVSCGTSTIPSKWGFLKCIVDASEEINLYGYDSKIHHLQNPKIAKMGDEYPSMNFIDDRSRYEKSINKSPYHYINNLPPPEKQGPGSLTIEAGMLQIILIYAIKLLQYLQSFDVHTSAKSCMKAGPLSYQQAGPRYRSCGNLISGRLNPVEKGHDDIQKTSDIFFNQDMDQERLSATIATNEFDMIFNASGKTMLAPIEQFNVCTKEEGSAISASATKEARAENVQKILKPDMDNSNLNKFQHPTNAPGSNPCKQWGSIMEINFGAGNNSSDEMFKNMISNKTFAPSFNRNGLDVATEMGKISLHGVENYFLNTNKRKESNYFGPTNVEGVDLTPDVGDLYEDHHDLRIFPSRGEGDGTGSGRLYIGVLIGRDENDALCRKYGRECQGEVAGGPVQLNYTDKTRQNSDDLIINGIILKYAVMAQRRGVPYNSVDWLNSKFSWFPMILTKVQDGHAAKQYNQTGTMFVQIGDAAYNAHYFSGMGVNNGFATVNLIFNRQESGISSTSSTRGFYDRMDKFKIMYNSFIAQESRAYVEKIREEFGSPRIIERLYGIQNSTISDERMFHHLSNLLSATGMPQSTFSRASNERTPARFFGFDASPETAARLETFHLQNNPQIQQLALRNGYLSRYQQANPNYSLFEI